MKFIEHCTSELICETHAAVTVPLGTEITLVEDSTAKNEVLCLVREYEGRNCRVDIVRGDLLNVFDDDKSITVGVLPAGYYVTRDDDGDWVLIPPADQTIFSEPGEPLLLAEGFLLEDDTKKAAVAAAQQHLTSIGLINR